VIISYAALDAIIDRTRTCDSKVTELLNTSNVGNKNKGSVSVKTEGSALGLELQEGQQSSVMAFEEAAPLVDLRQFEGQTVQKTTEGHHEGHLEPVDPAVLLETAPVPPGTGARRQRGPGECTKSQQLHPRAGRVLHLREGSAPPQTMGVARKARSSSIRTTASTAGTTAA